MTFDIAIFWFSMSIMLSCRTWELLLVAFLVSNFFKKSSPFKSAYYLFLLIGYFIDVCFGITWITYKIDTTNSIGIIMLFQEWFDTFFAPIWNTLLAINRCTAILFPLKQKEIWNFRLTLPTCLFLIFSPFIIDGYNLGEGFSSLSRLLAFQKAYLIRGQILNFILTMLILIIVIFAIYKSRNRTYSQESAKIEKWLIFQALLSSTILLISHILKYIAGIFGSGDWRYMLFYSICGIIYFLHTYCIILTHFIFSPRYRRAFINFYKNLFVKRKRFPTVIAIVKVSAVANGTIKHQ